jgi:hypothetical protein
MFIDDRLFDQTIFSDADILRKLAGNAVVIAEQDAASQDAASANPRS